MRQVFAGGHPAEALAATIYNWEAGREVYDVVRAGTDGVLQQLEPTLQQPYHLTIKHMCYPKHFRIRPTKGTIFLSPWPAHRVIVDLLERAFGLCLSLAPALFPPETRVRTAVADVTHHESLWVAAPPPGGREVTVLDQRASPPKEIGSGVYHSGLKWQVAPLSSIVRKKGRRCGQQYIYQSLFAFVVDLAPGDCFLGKQAPPPTRDVFWLPTGKDFHSPTVVPMRMLVLVKLEGESYTPIRYKHHQVPWDSMELFKKLPQLDVVCPRLEAAFHRAELAKSAECVCCQETLVGRCEALLSSTGGAAGLCAVCGAALRTVQEADILDPDSPWRGVVIEWVCPGELPTYQFEGGRQLWLTKPGGATGRGLISGETSRDSSRLLGIIRDPELDEFNSPHVRELGEGVLYKAKDIVVFEGAN